MGIVYLLITVTTGTGTTITTTLMILQHSSPPHLSIKVTGKLCQQQAVAALLYQYVKRYDQSCAEKTSKGK